jgi:hypothetical protein
MEKTFDIKQKKGWLGGLTTEHLHLAPHMTLNAFNVNHKVNQKDVNKRLAMQFFY